MIKKSTLPNGVRIVTEEIPYVRSVAMGIWVGAGSRDENTQNTGIAHFIEHMLFKGTEKRTAKQIAEALDAVGGQLNAFTSKEYTCYYAKVLDEHLEIAADLLSDMFFNSTLKEEDLEKEKNVILEEIKMYEDAPDELVHDIFSTAIWGDHPLGRPTLGTEDIILSLKRQDLLNFMNTLYTGDQVVVALAGSLNHDKIVEQLTPIFAAVPPTKTKSTYSLPKNLNSRIIKDKETEQVHLCIGSPGLALGDEKLYVMHVLNSVLGGGLSSRLFQEIREERGLAYSIFSYSTSYRDTGLFSIYAGLSRNNLNQVLDLVVEELKKFKQQGISPEELERAQNQLKGGLYLSLENVSNRMSRIGKSELCLNKEVTIEEVVKKIDKVSLDQVKQMSVDIFAAEKIAVSAIGTGLSEDSFVLKI